MTKDEALQMCLEYIETDAHERKYVRHAIKAALEAKDEPLAYLPPTASPENACYIQLQHKPLTDEDIALIDWESLVTRKDCVRAIEAKLKEKNT
jgi:hypothetical protein